MSTIKKKPKSDKIPKPINIKKEKTEEDRQLHPISHYVDDRLGLVKQIFCTLKPKTIMNLAPEFLKGTNLDEIEEMCLNELLYISTKRLKSIIEGTRCPTDTESSEDSDVQQKEEHISLEEISSDSDIGDSDTRRAKKKKKLAVKNADKGNESKPPGQISVLELLELQARARAIRSQLAMEPITKIEVNSDEEETTAKKQLRKQADKPSRNSNRTERKRKSSETATGKRSNSKEKHTNGSKISNGKEAQPSPSKGKKIKLKRNYRNSHKSPEKENNALATENEQSVNKSRSASPDVIPIQAEPETLLISDSTDDENEARASKMPALQQPAKPVIPEVESEPEEGEVREDIETETAENTDALTEENASVQPETINKSASVDDEPQEISIEAIQQARSTLNEDQCSDQGTAAPEQQLPVVSNAAVDDEDQNDDVISIGGDLENEMIEELAKEEEPAVHIKDEVNEVSTSKLPEHDEEDNDVISLDTSEDEREKLQKIDAESWHTRYLKSSKVSQVLAASRLGKRVRDKIKKSKHNEKRSEAKLAADKEEQAAQQQFNSKHEDGSMEQYQELLQHQRQRKSSNNSNKGEK